MPTYEYECEACGNNWEAEQRITESALKDCPKCGQAKARRLISGGSRFVLKGGGWYADLYSSSKPAAKSGDSKPAGDSKSESKPAAAESKPASSKPASSSSD